jgi:hypothetical protein
MTEYLSLMRRTVSEGFSDGGGWEPHDLVCQRESVLRIFSIVHPSGMYVAQCTKFYGVVPAGNPALIRIVDHYFFVARIPPRP